jgi:DNA-binding SARP family transcriptional activator
MLPQFALSPIDWQRAIQLIEAGAYEQAAELLCQAAVEQTEQALPTEMLAAICQICLVCSQLRAETERHHRAQEDASERERALKYRLYAILDLACGSVLPAAGESRAASSWQLGTADEPSLWQRFESLLTGWRNTLLPAKPEPVQPLLEAPAKQQAEAPLNPCGQKAGAHSLAIHCLGLFRVYRNDQVITPWHSLKGQSILKYLVTQHGTPVPKDILMDLFWPDADPESARRNLHQAIYSLRQTLRRGEPDFQPIQFEHECYRFNPELALWLDVEEFTQHAQSGRQLEVAKRWAEAASAYQRAEELYQGDFLEGDLYEDWASLLREQYRNSYLDLADRLSDYYRQQGNLAAAIELCQKILARDNCHERAHRRLMQCYQSQGQLPHAVRQYQLCAKLLKQELDVSPSAETQTLFAKITEGSPEPRFAG